MQDSKLTTTDALGNIIPRLYLMITVGTVYMAIPDAPVKEVMKDMLEMCRGVQHPLRGLFLRYYLMQSSREHLPVGDSDGPEGNLQVSIDFIITNFIEMNKLWVRLQHQGHSRDREKRTQERKELQIVVGSTLVGLSQLDGIDKNYYRKSILPAILEQVVQCRDVIAQEYLLDVITQVFPDEFHLHTLDLFLEAVGNLSPNASIKNILIKLIDRLSNYALAEADNNPDEEEPSDDKTTEDDNIKETTSSTDKTDETNSTGEADKTETEKPVKRYRGIPTNIDLFQIFWTHVSSLLSKRPDLPSENITALCVYISRLSLCCYPSRTANIDTILEFLVKNPPSETDNDSLQATNANVLELLLLLIQSYPKLLTVLRLANFVPLLESQSKDTRNAVASNIINLMLNVKKTRIESIEEATGLFKLLRVVIVEETDTGDEANGINGIEAKVHDLILGNATGEELAESDQALPDAAVANQNKLSKIVHLLYNRDVDVQSQLLEVARKALGEGKSFVRFTYPALVTELLRLIRRISVIGKNKEGEEFKLKLAHAFKFLQIVLVAINQAGKPDKTLRLYVEAGTIADQVGSEEASYEFYAQAFTIYEEKISDSRSQYQAVCLIASALQSSRNFSPENYDTLASKCALYGSKLLKKPDQCRAVYLASHLWWAVEIPALGESEDQMSTVVGIRDGKRVLECLQRALRVADACMDVAVSVELFVEILNRCLYYFERGNEQISVKFIIGLIELIQRNLDGVSSNPNGGLSISDSPKKHFERTLKFIEDQKEVDTRFHQIVW